MRAVNTLSLPANRDDNVGAIQLQASVQSEITSNAVAAMTVRIGFRATLIMHDPVQAAVAEYKNNA